MENLLLSPLLPIKWGSVDLPNSEPVYATNFSSQLALRILSLPCNLELQMHVHPAFYMGFGDLNSNPFSFIANPFTTEPSL